MNERLYQLMRQAQSVAYAKASAKKKTNSPQNNTVWNEFPEVFAELIVRECAEVIDAQKPVWQNTDVPAEIALDMAAKNIKAYFGVTE